MTRPNGWIGTAAALVVLCALGAWTPPPAPPAEAAQTDRAPVERRAGDPDFAPRFQEFLSRRIDELRARLDRLESARSSLDDGRSIRELLADLAPEDRRAFERPFDQRRPGSDGFGPGGADRPRTDALQPEPVGPPPTDAQVREFIEGNLPELHESITRVAQMTPEGAERIFGQLSPRVSEVMLAQRRDAQLGQHKLDELKIGLRVIDSIRRVREELRRSGATPEFENTFRPRLVELLSQQAEARERVRIREIELLEDRVAAMRDEAESHSESRDAEIEKIADRMIRRMTSGRSRHADSDTERASERRGSDD